MADENTETDAAPGYSPVAGESARAFAPFCAYFALGHRRRFAVAARQVGGPSACGETLLPNTNTHRHPHPEKQ